MNLRRLVCTFLLFLPSIATQAAETLATPFPDTDAPPRFAPRSEVHAQQRGNLQLVSLLAVHGTPYPGTQFTVLREEPDAFGKSRFTVMAVAGPHDHADFDLSPGRYLVQARNGAVTTEQPVEVPTRGTAKVAVVLDAGELHLGSLMDTGGQPADETWFRILREETDAYGRPVRVQVAGNGYSQTASFLLPAGRYIAEASYGDARVETAVHVRAGDVSSHELVLDAGKAELFATLVAGGEALDAVTFEILGLRGADWVEVARAEDAHTITFILPAGEYRVRARLDRAQAELPLRVEPGQTRSLELPLNAGELLLYATLAGETDPLLDGWFRLLRSGIPDIADVTDDGTRGPAHSMRYIVPAGEYLASVGLGESDGTAKVAVAAGESRTLAVDLDAARVSLSLVDDTDLAAAPLPFTWFSVYRIEQDAQGREWRRRVYNAGFYPKTDVVLPAGAYLAFARSDGQRGELSFTVAAGQAMTLTIPADRSPAD